MPTNAPHRPFRKRPKATNRNGRVMLAAATGARPGSCAYRRRRRFPPASRRTTIPPAHASGLRRAHRRPGHRRRRHRAHRERPPRHRPPPTHAAARRRAHRTIHPDRTARLLRTRPTAETKRGHRRMPSLPGGQTAALRPKRSRAFRVRRGARRRTPSAHRALPVANPRPPGSCALLLFVHDLGLGTGALRHRGDSERLANAILDLARDFRILAQEFARVVLALADLLAAIAVPRARLVDDLRLHAEIDDLALARNAFAVQDVEDRFAERRRHLVLDDLHARFVADHLVVLLDRADPANVETHRRVELQRVAARRGFRVAEHHADLHPDLVDEDHEAVRALDRARQLAQRLRHQAGLQAGQRVAHLAFDFGLRHERRDRVDDDHVDRARADQRVDDFERLLTRVRLRDQQLRHVHAELRRILDVERVLRVDERRRAAELLHLGDHLQRERRLAGRFRPVDFDHTAARQATDAERDIETERARGHHLDILDRLAVAEPHDRPFAELLLDLRERGGERLALFGSQPGAFLAFFHESSFAMMSSV
ncbi:hypothetical protein BURPS1710b_0972 [Burkholderia pseudomallei 1710b]|uniref:Uncharacterized protein n=1 Tax=Burkholderia pseudomallei (strain 1710b) TaxID=320372 RepID=Q3JVM0_BURP1|nr:hypothetical protein BURPS1710b_0972 [Burkholderia pseudomallei 1710b]